MTIGNCQFNCEVQHWPEGPKVNSHARKGVEQAIRLIPGPPDRQSIDALNHCRTCGAFVLLRPLSTPSRAWLLTFGPAGLCSLARLANLAIMATGEKG